MLNRIESTEVYQNPSWNTLRIDNPHVNVINSYDFLYRHPDAEALFKTHLEEQVLTAIKEDFLGTGEYDLKFLRQSDGSVKFTNASFPDQSLEELAQRGVNLKMIKNQSYEREWGEYELATQLTAFAKTAPEGSVCLWTSPPGNKSDYRH